jgi:hypothetical protein
LSELSSPKASRQARPRWLDPKLFLGILLVLASMAFGARIIANADKSTEVWVAKEDIPENTVVDPAKMLARTKIRFTSDEDAKLYLSARNPFPKGVRSVRTVAKGELVPARALTKQPDDLLIDLPVPINGDGIPFDAAKGDRVDVWAVPAETKGDEVKAEAVKVLSDVQLMSLPKSGGLGGSGGGAATVRFNITDDLNMPQIVFYVMIFDISIVEHVAPRPVGGN